MRLSHPSALSQVHIWNSSLWQILVLQGRDFWFTTWISKLFKKHRGIMKLLELWKISLLIFSNQWSWSDLDSHEEYYEASPMSTGTLFAFLLLGEFTGYCRSSDDSIHTILSQKSNDGLSLHNFCFCFIYRFFLHWIMSVIIEEMTDLSGM